MNLKSEKLCSKNDCDLAGQMQPISNFDSYNRNGKIQIRSDCKICHKKIKRKYRELNIDRIRKDDNNRQKQRRINEPEKIRLQRKSEFVRNKSKYRTNARKYYFSHRDEIIKKTGEYSQNRVKNDIQFALKKKISHSIRMKINKNNLSSIKYLPFLLSELKEHLEKQFEPWMNWSNWGIYKVSDWDDNDLSTWRWQIDHIVPHSHFHYSSMEDENFRKCWALENLRPYSAKQNLLDSNKR